MDTFPSNLTQAYLPNHQRTVVIVATLDTLAPAAKFLRDELAARSVATILVDPGILGAPGIQADITRWQVAEAAGTTLGILLGNGDENTRIAKQTEGLCNIVQSLFSQGNLNGIISIEDSDRIIMSAAAMRILPFSIPKLMLSSIPPGSTQLRPYSEAKDVCIVHSAADIFDVNVINRPILINAANAIAGMVLHSEKTELEETNLISITRLDLTTSCVKRVKRLLETQGYQVVPFNANGFGGPAMEELIQAGKFTGVIDLSVHEIIDDLFHGLGGAKNRLEALSRTNLPAIISVGGIDHLRYECEEKASHEHRQRCKVVHDPFTTIFQPRIEEMESAARYMLEPLNRALGPTIVLIPSVGFSDINRPGGELYYPEGNQAVTRVLREGLRPDVPVIVVDAHINQPVFADVISVCMSRLLMGENPHSIAARYQFT